jgi:hypothetical protein
MGDVVKFSAKGRKKPKKTPESPEQDVPAMVCGACDSLMFFLATDGRLFCADCRHPVAAYWTLEEDYPAA